MKAKKVCRFRVVDVFKFSNEHRIVYLAPELAFVTDSYCESFSQGRGCKFWNGKECTDKQKWSKEDFNDFYYSRVRELRKRGYIIQEL